MLVIVEPVKLAVDQSFGSNATHARSDQNTGTRGRTRDQASEAVITSTRRELVDICQIFFAASAVGPSDSTLHHPIGGDAQVQIGWNFFNRELSSHIQSLVHVLSNVLD